MNDSPATPAPPAVTYAAIVQRFADREIVARCLGVGANHLNTMLTRGRVPPGYWKKLRRGAAYHGVSIRDGELEAAEMHYQDAKARERIEPSLPLIGGAGCGH